MEFIHTTDIKKKMEEAKIGYGSLVDPWIGDSKHDEAEKQAERAGVGQGGLRELGKYEWPRWTGWMGDGRWQGVLFGEWLWNAAWTCKAR